MCTDCAARNIADVVNMGVSLEVATRLYRDALLQHHLMNEPDDDMSAEEVLQEARDLIGVVNEAAGALREMHQHHPEMYEAFLQVRAAIAMLGEPVEPS